MEARSEDALARMRAARTELEESGKGVVDSAAGHMTDGQDKAKATAELAHQSAMTQLTSGYADARARVEKKREQNLARIGAARDEELARVARAVRADLKAMDRTSDRAATQMDAQGQDTTGAEEALAGLEEAREQAQRARTKQAALYQLMRDEVFHTDDAIDQARAQLVADGASEDQLAEFDEKVAVAATPVQVATIAEEVAG